MLHNEVAITAVSIASALGRRLEELSQAILEQRRGITYAHRYASWMAAPLGQLPLGDWGITAEEELLSDQVMRKVLMATLDQLAEETQVFARYRPEEIGFYLGTTTSGIDGFFSALHSHRQTNQAILQFLSPNMQQSWITDQMRSAFPLRGPSYTFSSSCAAAAQAIGQAYDAVRSGICKVAIAGGIDILNRVTLSGFDALQILDHDYCEPFTGERKGINLGEGGALFLLERSDAVPGLAKIHGYAALSEAHHMVQPAPRGIWMRATMETALQRVGWQAEEIDYINVHGTGTEGNDCAEAQAIADIFHEPHRLHVTKRLTGHCLGAAGAIEAAITIGMLQRLGSWQKLQGLPIVSKVAARGLSNSFGFGGSNVSLVFSAVCL